MNLNLIISEFEISKNKKLFQICNASYCFGIAKSSKLKFITYC